MENNNIKEATYNFINALSEYAELNIDRDAVKIAVYKKGKLYDVIEYTHNIGINGKFNFLAQDSKNKKNFLYVPEDEPDTIIACHHIEHDIEKDVHLFLIKPDNAKIIRKFENEQNEIGNTAL